MPPEPQEHESEDPGDSSLIDWMLSLTPEERLEVLDRNVADILELRRINGEEWATEHSSEG